MTPKYSIVLKKKTADAVAQGYPWVFRSDVEINSELELAPPGETAIFCDARGKALACGYFNPANSLFGRILSQNPKEVIDETFFYRRFELALAKRAAVFSVSYYRLIHSEGDTMPGLIVDRFNDIFVCQTTTAGMEFLKPRWLPALHALFSPRAIIFRDDTSARKKESLPQSVTHWGDVPEMPVEIIEHDTHYLADLVKGQKTGWFYDQRANRQLVARHAAGKSMLDLYSHSGGFGLASAVAGAAHIKMVDASSLALTLSKKAAALNTFPADCEWVEADIFELLPEWIAAGKTFEMVVADPPAFIKDKKLKASGLKGYEKLARLCAPIVKKGGHLFIASCSHHASPGEFRRAVEAGFKHADASFRHLATTGADLDHPPHPQLVENEYLKGLLYLMS